MVKQLRYSRRKKDAQGIPPLKKRNGGGKDAQGIPPLKKRNGGGVAQSESEKAAEFNGQQACHNFFVKKPKIFENVKSERAAANFQKSRTPRALTIISKNSQI